MSQMFQQALWIGRIDSEDEGQEVDLPYSTRGAGLGGSSAPQHFQRQSQLQRKFLHRPVVSGSPFDPVKELRDAVDLVIVPTPRELQHLVPKVT